MSEEIEIIVGGPGDPGGILPPLIVRLPDRGDDAVEVRLLLASGERIDVSYNAFSGLVDVCIYEPSDKKGPGDDDGFAPKPCAVTNWTDEFDAKGNYKSSMHPAPRFYEREEHTRLATQIVISAGTPLDKDEDES